VMALATGADPEALQLGHSARFTSAHGCTWELSRTEGGRDKTLTVALTREDRDVEFIVRHLKSIPLFAPLPEPSIRSLIDYLRLEKFPERTAIIRQNEPGTHLFVLIKGEVSVVKADANQRENVLARLRKGDVFGEMSLITGDPCSATIRTATPISALTIAKADFQRLLERQPSLNIYFNKLLAQRLRKTNTHIEEEIAKGVLGKLSMISLPELTQTISSNQRTGVLNLYRGEASAEVHFADGQIVNAMCGELDGAEAFYALVAWSEGDFRFAPGEITAERKIVGDPMGLLMEGLRRLDELQREGAAA
jgi:CRP/FNR family transcriptional regulator, cyclic AMP receptor protein